MRTVAIIQARMGGERLPGKVLKKAAGKPLLQHMIERLMRCETLDDIVVAMPKTRESQPIAQLIAIIEEDEELPARGYESKVGWVGGDELDVLGRVLGTAQTMQADVIVELTADCPLIDPEIVDEAVRRFHAGQGDGVTSLLKLDFVSTSRPSLNPRNVRHAYPPGMDVRVFPTSVLEEVDRVTQDPADREHVSLYIWEHQRRYWCHDYLAPEELQDDVRLTVDTLEDLDLVRRIFDHFTPSNDFSLADILRVLGEHPTWRRINESVEQRAVR